MGSGRAVRPLGRPSSFLHHSSHLIVSDTMSSSEDDMPLAARAQRVEQIKPTSNGAVGNSRARANSSQPSTSNAASDEEASSASSASDASDSDSEDDVPLSQRTPKKKVGQKRKQQSREQPAKRQRSAASARKPGSKAEKGEVKWQTLVHCGVLFPPDYEPHGVKMLYDGKPVDLTPEQEEVANMFAIMKETDYMNKPTFLKNFWDGFKEVLGKNHVIKGLDKCDFTPIYDHLMAERDKKKAMTKEVGLLSQ